MSVNWIIAARVKVLRAIIDSGEASAIALALELDDCLLIMDDLKGRVLAEELGIRVTGTFGVIIEAKLAGHNRLGKIAPRKNKDDELPPLPRLGEKNSN